MLKKSKIRLVHYLITIGIIFSVTSIVLSYLVVEDNAITISVKEDLVNKNNNHIAQRWDSAKSFSSNVGSAIILLSQKNNIQNKDISALLNLENIITDYDTYIENKHSSKFTIKELINLRDNYEYEVYDAIDNIYFENTDLLEDINELKLRNNRFKIIALFLNVIGLAMIFSKEIFVYSILVATPLLYTSVYPSYAPVVNFELAKASPVFNYRNI